MNVQLLTGFSTSPQEFVSDVKNFMTTSSGWSLVDTVSDVPTDRDYVLVSSGVVASNNDEIYVRIRGFEQHVHLYGYSYWLNSTTFSGEIHNDTYSRVYADISDFQYWVFSDADHIKFVIRDVGLEEYYHGYAGLIETYYDYQDDPLPLLIFGTHSGTSYWSDGLSAYMSTTSGGNANYKVWSTYSSNFADTSRGSRCGGYRLILYHDVASQKEVRGEPKGVFQTATACAGAGIQLAMPSGVYYSFSKSGSQSYSYMYGPVDGPQYCS